MAAAAFLRSTSRCAWTASDRSSRCRLATWRSATVTLRRTDASLRDVRFMTSMRFTRSENDCAPSTYMAASGVPPLYVATTMSASWDRAAARFSRAIFRRMRFAAIRRLTPAYLDWAASNAFTAASSCTYSWFSWFSAAWACARLDAIESAPALAGAPSAAASASSETAARTGTSRRRRRCVGRLDMARDFTTREHPQTQAFL